MIEMLILMIAAVFCGVKAGNETIAHEKKQKALAQQRTAEKTLEEREADREAEREVEVLAGQAFNDLMVLVTPRGYKSTVRRLRPKTPRKKAVGKGRQKFRGTPIHVEVEPDPKSKGKSVVFSLDEDDEVFE